MLKKSSQELLHQMGQYLARIIPSTRIFKFVQIYSKNLQKSSDLFKKGLINLILMND